MKIIESTTIKELPDKIKSLDISPETSVKVTIEEINAASHENRESKYLFLNDDVWDGEDTPTDLADNHDKYLYGEAE